MKQLRVFPGNATETYKHLLIRTFLVRQAVRQSHRSIDRSSSSSSSEGGPHSFVGAWCHGWLLYSTCSEITSVSLEVFGHKLQKPEETVKDDPLASTVHGI